jgi:hypothetical protein
MASGDRIVSPSRQSGFLASSANVESAKTVPEPIYEAIVVDIVVDHLHPEYSPVDGYNVGAAKVRMFSVDHSSGDDFLNWADPLDFEIQQLPLLGELVIVHRILGNFFYTRRVPIAHRVQENGMLKLNEVLRNKFTNTISKTIANTVNLPITKHKFGEYFKPDSRVRPLKHFEGDTIFQGRMGHSIRFGSSQMEPGSKKLSPNIILRTGQAKDAEINYVTKNSIFGLTIEDINKDASSIWMTSDQTVTYLPITDEAGSFNRSLVNPPQKFDKAQIIMNSDRVVLNSKREHIMLYSTDEIYLNSFNNTGIDTDANIILTANLDIVHRASRNIDNVADEDFTIRAGDDVFSLSMNKTSFLAKKLFVGSVETDAEPLVGGTSLSIFLARLILTLMGTPPAIPPQITSPRPIFPALPPIPGIATIAHVVSPMGPFPLNPLIVTGLIKLYTELLPPNLGQGILKLPFAGAPFNSKDNFVSLINENPTIEKNDFKNGKQRTVQNNEWVLSDNYYRIE